MDEPLSALDRLTKDEILPFLERLHEKLSLPMIYVSHDMTEVERFADHLVLMEAGRVVASGPLTALQSDPALPLVRTRDAAISLDATVESYDPGYGLITLPSAADDSSFPLLQEILVNGAACALLLQTSVWRLSRRYPAPFSIRCRLVSCPRHPSAVMSWSRCWRLAKTERAHGYWPASRGARGINSAWSKGNRSTHK